MKNIISTLLLHTLSSNFNRNRPYYPLYEPLYRPPRFPRPKPPNKPGNHNQNDLIWHSYNTLFTLVRSPYQPTTGVDTKSDISCRQMYKYTNACRHISSRRDLTDRNNKYPDSADPHLNLRQLSPAQYARNNTARSFTVGEAVKTSLLSRHLQPSRHWMHQIPPSSYLCYERSRAKLSPPRTNRGSRTSRNLINYTINVSLLYISRIIFLTVCNTKYTTRELSDVLQRLSHYSLKNREGHKPYNMIYQSKN